MGQPLEYAAQLIDPAEFMRRKDAVDFARRSVRLEDFALSPEVEVEEISRRYVAGEMPVAEHVAAIKALS